MAELADQVCGLVGGCGFVVSMGDNFYECGEALQVACSQCEAPGLHAGTQSSITQAALTALAVLQESIPVILPTGSPATGAPALPAMLLSTCCQGRA